MQLICVTVGFIMQRKWRVSLIVCVGVFMSSLDLFIVNIAFPAIGHHFGGASLGTLSWILSGYAIATSRRAGLGSLIGLLRGGDPG